MAKTLTQQRATVAYERVAAFLSKPEAAQKKYATIAHKMPALLRSAGLCQALHFVQSRPDEHQRRWLEDLATHLGARVDAGIRDVDTLLDTVRTADTWSYLVLTREAIACADWHRRMVQGVLRIDAAEADRDE